MNDKCDKCGCSIGNDSGPADGWQLEDGTVCHACCVEDTKHLVDAETQRSKLAGNIASAIGAALGQTFEQHNGAWWLFTAGKPARPLKPDEVEWHVERNHKPFVHDGIDKDDPRWWDDP